MLNSIALRIRTMGPAVSKLDDSTDCQFRAGILKALSAAMVN
jgi:hypothetical protein